jgi:hypothetical protein
MGSRAQSDFCLLSVPGDGLDTFDDHPAFLCRTSSSRVEKLADSSACNEKYVPVNFIDAEIYALIERWESCAKDEPAAKLTMPIDLKSEDRTYEPIRQLPNAAAPKRFYRTFWRSICRRLVEVSCTD